MRRGSAQTWLQAGGQPHGHREALPGCRSGTSMAQPWRQIGCALCTTRASMHDRPSPGSLRTSTVAQTNKRKDASSGYERVDTNELAHTHTRTHTHTHTSVTNKDKHAHAHTHTHTHTHSLSHSLTLSLTHPLTHTHTRVTNKDKHAHAAILTFSVSHLAVQGKRVVPSVPQMPQSPVSTCASSQKLHGVWRTCAPDCTCSSWDGVTSYTQRR